MRDLSVQGCVILLLLVLGFGCKQDQNRPPLSSDKIPAELQSAFAQASAEDKESVAQAAAALEKKDSPAALINMQVLFAKPDLTPEQREALQKSMISLNQELRAKAAQGDANAAEALQVYRSRK